MNMQARSGIPKVVGILMIIFGAIGLLMGLLGLAGGSLADGGIDAVKTFNTMSMVFGVIGLGISALHLVGGINAVKYKSSAPKLCLMYGALAIIVQIAWGAIVFAWLKPKMGIAANLLGVGVMIGVVFGSIWPIVVLALMSRPGAKAACTN